MLQMMLLNFAGPLRELSFNESHCIQLENRVITRGTYICEYVPLFCLLTAYNMYTYTHIHTHTHTHARVRVVPFFGLLVFGVFPRSVQELVERLFSLLSRQAPDSRLYGGCVVYFCVLV